MKPRLTVAVITRNEETELRDFMDNALRVGDEVVVLDDGSSDRSVEIAQQFGPRVLVRVAPRGIGEGFCDLRNRAAEMATGDWILHVDADMRFPAALAREIRDRIESNNFDAFRFRLRQYFLNHRARFGGRQYWNQSWLVRRERARFQQKIHERIVVDAPAARIGQLREPAWHINDQTWEERLHKSIQYSLFEAERLAAGGPVGWWHLVWRPFWTFIRSYVLFQGFRDGVLGLMLARHNSNAVFNWYAIAWSRQNPCSREDLEMEIKKSFEADLDFRDD